MKQFAGPKVYSLEDVQKQFSAWRSRKDPGCLIPLELWKAAVHLAEGIPAYKVAKALGLNYSDLIKHIEEAKSSGRDGELLESAFLELPSSPPPTFSHCVVEMENRHGDKMKMYFTAHQTVDPVALSRAFLGVQL